MNKKRKELTNEYERMLSQKMGFDQSELSQDVNKQKALAKAEKRIAYKNMQREEASLRRGYEEN